MLMNSSSFIVLWLLFIFGALIRSLFFLLFSSLHPCPPKSSLSMIPVLVITFLLDISLFSLNKWVSIKFTFYCILFTGVRDSKSASELPRDNHIFLQEIEQNIKTGEVWFAVQKITSSVYLYVGALLACVFNTSPCACVCASIVCITTRFLIMPLQFVLLLNCSCFRAIVNLLHFLRTVSFLTPPCIFVGGSWTIAQTTCTMWNWKPTWMR